MKGLHGIRQKVSKSFEIFQARMWGIDPQRLRVPGFLLTPDRNLLANYARKVGAKGEIVEIGSFLGLSAIIMGLANPYAKITCIDPCDASGDEISTEGYLQVIGADICKQYYLLKKNLQKYGIRNAHIIRSKSQDVLEKWQTPIDLLFVDGDHSYEASKSDLTGWGIWVKPSGWVIMHDSGPEGWPGPIRVVQEILNTGQWVSVESTATARVLRKSDLYKAELLKLGC